MKKLCTLFGMFLAITTFAQQLNQHKYYADPNSARPASRHHAGNSNSRSAGQACDTADVLDYSTYNENFAVVNGLNFHGTWNGTPAPFANEITSFVDTFTAHQGEYKYAEVNFDSIAFADLASHNTLFYPRSSSTIYLDSLGMFIGIFGDTTSAGKMLHDSLIFTVYAVNGNSISASPSKVVVFDGPGQLAPFLVGPNYLHYAQIGIGQQFTHGQGFAVRMDYLNKDTSSHCILSYTFADSCGTIVYQGGTYSSPAYPSPMYGTSLFGEIRAGVGAAASVSDANSGFAYQLAGVAANCSYVYTQNWEFLPVINVCVDYGVTIQPAATASCPNAVVSLNAAVYGTRGTVTYTWSASSGSLSSTSIQTPDLTMPASGNVTVTLTINDGNASISDSVVIHNNGIGIAITTTNLALTCGDSLRVSTQTSGIQTGLSYVWSTGSVASSVMVHQPGIYTITVTNNKTCSASASANVTYNNSMTNTVSFTTPVTVCVSHLATFVNHSTHINGWNAIWDMGDGTQVLSTDAIYTYNSAGLKNVVLTMDSNGCSFSSPAHGVTVYPLSNHICDHLGIDEVTFSNSINMFPNPTNGNVNISVVGVEKNITIRIYNILGSEVHSFTSSDVSSSFNKNFDFSEFAGGTYLIKIQSGDKIAVKKLTISK